MRNPGRTPGERPRATRGALLLALSFFVSCGTPVVSPSRAAFGEPCEDSEACASALVCMARRCTLPCNTDDECPAGGRCHAGGCETALQVEHVEICEGDDCCATDADCDHSADRALCTVAESTTDCQGEAWRARCNAGRCELVHEEDDTICGGRLHTCPDNLVAIPCAATRDQPVPICPTECVDDEGCEPGFTCRDHKCGVATCTGTSCGGAQCAAGCHCGDGVCCDESAERCCQSDASCANRLACNLATRSCYETCSNGDSSRCAVSTDVCWNGACCTPQCAGKCDGASDGCGGSCAVNDCAGCCDAGRGCITPADVSASACGAQGLACVSCDDQNPCTDDHCGGAGCVHSPRQGSCTDDNACTVGDSCNAGVCVPGAGANCDDGNLCTTDSCSRVTGCLHVNNTVTCSDGNACTTGDKCSGGGCVAAGTANCDDGNPCTTDTCSATGGCVHTNNNASCSDGNACTSSDVCSNGACVAGPAANCDDGNVCTTDSCAPSTGCVHVNNTASCSDDNACTIGDRCSAGACVPSRTRDCADSNPCTDDSCAPSSGCVHTVRSGACGTGYSCQAGTCCSDSMGSSCWYSGSPPNDAAWSCRIFESGWCTYPGQYGVFSVDNCHPDTDTCGGGEMCWVTCNLAGTVDCNGYCY